MTPGPWTLLHGSATDEPLPSVMAKQKETSGLFYVAQCNSIVDARAIACLPELVEAAHSLIEALPDNASFREESNVRALRRILARIDGGEQ